MTAVYIFQNHPHFSGAPALQHHPVRHAGGGTDRRFRKVLCKGWERDQPDEERLRGGAEMLRFPALGLHAD